jgi:hypothetical protein
MRMYDCGDELLCMLVSLTPFSPIVILSNLLFVVYHYTHQRPVPILLVDALCFPPVSQFAIQFAFLTPAAALLASASSHIGPLPPSPSPAATASASAAPGNNPPPPPPQQQQQQFPHLPALSAQPPHAALSLNLEAPIDPAHPANFHMRVTRPLGGMLVPPHHVLSIRVDCAPTAQV